MGITINWFKCRYWVMHRIEIFLWMIIDQWTGKRAHIYVGHKVRKLCKFSFNTVCFLRVFWSSLSNMIYALCIVHFFPISMQKANHMHYTIHIIHNGLKLFLIFLCPCGFTRYLKHNSHPIENSFVKKKVNKVLYFF